jgi:PBP1b-binding outer membrane lipoprotein LpoB
MKKVVSLVVAMLLAYPVFFAGCDEHKSKPAAPNQPSDHNNVSKAAEAPVLEVNPQPVSKEVPEVNTQPVSKEVPVVNTQQVSPTRTPDVIFVPTPQEVVEKMLELVHVTKDDLLYDLGCGDGRIVVTAAKKYGCKAVGYDIDPQRIKESLENVEKNQVGDLVTIEQKDIFTLDLSDANVITLYLLPSLNVKLIPQLEKLKPGSRIVSHDFDMRGVEPDQVVEVTTSGDGANHTIYVWTTPLKKTQ